MPRWRCGARSSAASSPAASATPPSSRSGKAQFDYVDVLGEHLTGDRKIVSDGVVIAGTWWHASPEFLQRPGA